MSAHGEFKITNPDGIEMTMTITMTVREWKIIQSKLNCHATNAEWNLVNIIGQAINKAAKEFIFFEEVK